jgi:hypothetical protein
MNKTIVTLRKGTIPQETGSVDNTAIIDTVNNRYEWKEYVHDVL